MDPNLNSSQSLEIDEPLNKIAFSSSDDQVDSPDYDLDYSREDQSLSFQIEALQNSTHKPRDSLQPRESQKIGSILSNDPPKRRRKEIFDKYRQPAVEQPSIAEDPSVGQNQDFMRTFDEIFNVNSPRNASNNIIANQESPKKFFKKKPSANLDFQTQPIANSKKDSISMRRDDSNRSAAYTDQVEIVKLNQPDLGASDFFKTPLDKKQTPVKPRNSIGENDILNMEDIKYRFSYIQGKENVSLFHDSSELAEILGSEIFKQETQKTQTSSTMVFAENKPQLLAITKEQPKSPDIHSKQKYSSNQNSNQNSAQKGYNQDYDSPLQIQKINENVSSMSSVSKFSDVYDKIDVSASVTSSVMMRDTRYMPSDTGFLGSQYRLGQAQTQSAKNIGIFSSPVLQKTISQKLIEPEEHLDQGLPIFIRKIRYLNSIYPNFKHPKLSYSPESENEFLQKIVHSFLEAIRFLEKTLKNIQDKEEKRDNVLKQFSKSLSVQKFMEGLWRDYDSLEGTHRLEPRINFSRRQWNQKKVTKALENYKKISEHYYGCKLNLNSERGIEKYFEIRRKFWNVETNLLMIAEDMYIHIQDIRFPEHYDQILQVLQTDEVLYSEESIVKIQMLLQKIKHLRNQKQILCSSQIGWEAITKMQNILRLSTSF